jgi:protein TonB
MLAYAANRPVVGKRQSSPNAMLIVISAHVALVAAVMSVKMDFPQRIKEPPTIIDLLPDPIPPQPIKLPTSPQPRHVTRVIDNPRTNVPLPPITGPIVDPGLPGLDPRRVTGAGTNIITAIQRPVVTPMYHDARLLTPPAELKPPYPPSKLLSEEEAVLTLRLVIDERGRVVSVDPVGRADSAFLEAARRYMIARWRYQPATDDGRAISSSLTVTLRFELNG